ncbi:MULTISPECIES: SDR family NAD(P)-dependent oxidoreductase [Rhodococcus]|uniref:SDR family oxidoreductase n=1 Tax=Rhodococcus oxybenzonivorans TaxID=1990687 RepID=A0AAE5A3U0_9NOCA|nr:MULTISPECIES: SDR family oxidoreductase [Rhodococcus]MDV7244114.1 SDR family oxidoreductase [Rhodococcus oxybenzonivorans]MDV7263105.1 SDR family oxidoreductase [Rhodococcus oxybenzonivorans]MDV7274644.1 SDR family oxidoreductase [Rhodococcus oxybenzonivorans]MDV7335957.1 SDR family oxidoreductase [Rhodococcus oxybenzonivorans]MDV7345594.1 SDR family oxidoreductase [Rhodococcus oxybenzonivorans]
MSFDVSGTTVLITGASAGLGAEFARRFAGRGADLVLVARRVDRLEQLATELRTAHHVSVTVIPFDLATPGAGERLRTELTARDIRIDSLINNAGFGTHGDFASADLERLTAEIQLNVTTLVELSHTFLPDLLRGRGALVNVASTAAFQPTPGMAVYGATKAFVLSFTEALWAEARGTGLTVLAVCPGPTRTEFFDVVGSEDAAVGRMQTADQVVTTALRALDRRSTPPSVVSGLMNWVSSVSTRFATRRIGALASGRLLGDVRMRTSVMK